MSLRRREPSLAALADAPLRMAPPTGEGGKEGDGGREASTNAKLAKLHDMREEDATSSLVCPLSLSLSLSSFLFLFVYSFFLRRSGVRRRPCTSRQDREGPSRPPGSSGARRALWARGALSRPWAFLCIWAFGDVRALGRVNSRLAFSLRSRPSMEHSIFEFGSDGPGTATRRRSALHFIRMGHWSSLEFPVLSAEDREEVLLCCSPFVSDCFPRMRLLPQTRPAR